MTIIEHIAAAQTSIEVKVLRLNKPDWALGFFFIKQVMGAVAAWDGASVLTPVSASVKVGVDVGVAVAFAVAVGVAVGVCVAVAVGVGDGVNRQGNQRGSA